MNRLLKNTIILILLSVNVFLIFLTYYYNLESNTLKKSYKTISNKNKNAVSKYNNTTNLTLESNNQYLSKKIVVEHDGKKILLRNTFKNKSQKLVFRYTELNCKVCIDSTMKILNKFSEFLGKKNVILLTTYDNDKYFYLYKRVNKPKFKIYNLKDYKLDLKVEHENIPYIFLLNNNLEVSNLFIPDKSNTNHLVKYLNSVTRILNKDL